ncbi:MULTISPECIES: SDR family oxidoreductase [unclassified Colwellia]|uniref:SDR family oxidoreductase n=1 Tax=unclassified Colwellia TaxID=196834 RepID=UPI0015F3DE29|nr:MULTISPECIES: SDR family oxidoreductase [unclassified Colwellia]MBA6355439.1 SDR family oxidoreductase [Colwellia sp. BRX8-3]MBA6358785.1 SDR family oxidoreductase [Colwellia sp. BRX8-6]MBA6367240.1 SDR family oxidoreductase [Colwellia sp. BRX8-5]MBA6376271.1 SDR family oxidoreductase [Colwellia sp. BRX8-2]MBA6382270.1 SDR family oxidoreductase [Colwellia sp. BRX10-9]
MVKNVAIIGCGWLGHALAKQLLREEYRVTVTVQSEEKKQRLAKEQIDTELLILPVEDPKSTVLSVFGHDTLIISITPQIRQGRSDYPEKVAQLIEMAELGRVKKIVLLSSTAVYNGLSGLVDEQSVLDMNADKVATLIRAEKAAEAFSGETVILRLAGLVGPERHPGRFLQGRKLLSDPQAFINLIHQDDAVGVLMEIIKDENIRGIYNVVSATETSKQHYYHAAAEALNLPLPEFSFETSMRFGKRINDEKLRNSFTYQFTHDDLIVWLYKSVAGL